VPDPGTHRGVCVDEFHHTAMRKPEKLRRWTADRESEAIHRSVPKRGLSDPNYSAGFRRFQKVLRLISAVVFVNGRRFALTCRGF